MFPIPAEDGSIRANGVAKAVVQDNLFFLRLFFDILNRKEAPVLRPRIRLVEAVVHDFVSFPSSQLLNISFAF